MLDIEQAIREVGTVYQALTGRPIEAGRSELPHEHDPRELVEGRYRQFRSILESPAAAAAAGTNGTHSVPGAPAVPAAGHGAPSPPAWSPPLSVIEHEGEVCYEIELSGVSREQVGVSVLGPFLVVRGCRGGAAPAKGALRWSERPAGTFQRVITLPAQARRDGIHASLSEGVLVVTVPTDGPGGPALDIEIR